MNQSTCFGARKVNLFLIIQPLGQSPYQLNYFDVHYLATSEFYSQGVFTGLL